ATFSRPATRLHSPRRRFSYSSQTIPSSLPSPFWVEDVMQLCESTITVALVRVGLMLNRINMYPEMRNWKRLMVSWV
ncbi:hypothetical protein LINGRAHAP2_LOCUS10277, partial [Linum grandiflorum]